MGRRYVISGSENSQGVVIEVFEKLAFPGVPDIRVGSADVGNGQQVKRRQVTPSSLTTEAKAATTSGSAVSCFWATTDMTRC